MNPPPACTEPPNIHRHYRLRAIPVKVKKTKLKRIELKKLRPPNKVKGYNYGLPPSPPSPPDNSPIKIQSMLGDYTEHNETKSGLATAESQEYIEEIDDFQIEEKHKTEAITYAEAAAKPAEAAPTGLPVASR